MKSIRIKPFAIATWLVVTSAPAGLIMMVLVVSGLSPIMDLLIVKAAFDTKLIPELIFFSGCFGNVWFHNKLFTLRKPLRVQVILSFAGYAFLKLLLWQMAQILSAHSI